MSNTQDPIARQTPLVDLLAAVPADARLTIEQPDGKGTHFIPIGRLCREAIAALQPAAAQPPGDADAKPCKHEWSPEYDYETYPGAVKVLNSYCLKCGTSAKGSGQ